MGVLERMADLDVDRVAAGVIDAEMALETYGDVGEVFAWSSVTKPLVALAVLIEIEQGTVDLDEPAGPEGSTIRHLLAHASGLPLHDRDPVAEPGKRRVYSSAGFEVLAECLEERTGSSFEKILAERVLDPLGMGDTRLAGSPGHGAEGSLEDLLTLGRELLDPTLIGRDLYEEATSVVFPGLDGVLPGFGRQEPNDWGLGFEIRDGKSPHWTGGRNSQGTFGHFGQSGSFLWIDPEVGLACGFLGNRDFGDWAKEAWPELSDAVLDEYASS